MGRTITSIIEIQTEGSAMKSRHKDRDTTNHTKGKPAKSHTKSTATSDKHRFFHGVQQTQDGVTQTVNVTVNVEQPKDDCITSCFSAIGACFGKGAKGAAGA